MLIHIENYRNIKTLDYEPEEGKVNFLFGICGSGKSSLLKAINDKAEAEDATIGMSTEDIVVSMNGENPQFDKSSIYDEVHKNLLFEESSKSDYFDIFVGDTSALGTLEQKFNETISQLLEKQGSLYTFRGQVDDLMKNVNKPGAKGTYTPSSKLNKMTNALSEAKPVAKEAIRDLDQNHLSWVLTGFTISEDFASKKCPFCNQEIQGSYLNRLEAIQELEPAAIRPLFKSSSLFQQLNIAEPNYDNDQEVKQFKSEIEEIYKIRNDVEKVITLCSSTHSISALNNEFEPIELSSSTVKRFPEISALIESINENSISVKQLLGQMKTEFNKIVNGNASTINTQLRALGIPYHFTIRDANRDDKTASYSLMHIHSKQDIDMRAQLSTGERNLIALLLFLYREDSEIVLIDDPASSYDDYRRTQLFDLILSCQAKTIIVVSHDQAFIKRAARAANKDRLGKIQQIVQKKERIEIVDITKDSFGCFSDFITNRITHADSYYQIAVNLRLYTDIHKEQLGDTVWGYTSAIIHETSSEEIRTLLSQNGVTEAEILEELNDLLKAEIPPYQDSIDMTTDHFSNFERLIVKREELRNIKGRTEEQERFLGLLNDLVHMNDSMLVCLNPYQYDVWAPSLNELL